MIIELDDDFDLRKTGDCGQAFRWNFTDDFTVRVRAGKKETIIHELAPGTVEIDCSEEDESFWKKYLDVDTSYRDIAALVDKEDFHLSTCAENAKGIRILHQDLFEMLITFIISQRKSMPAIRTSVERLCEACGSTCFPDAASIAGLTDAELAACGLGYRAEYIRLVSEKVADGSLNLKSYESLSDDDLKEKLMEIRGVGEKVASCIMLFGYHRLNAFPKDVWINRELTEHYPDGFNYKKYEPYCGVMQQYLFYGATHRK